MSTLYFIRHGQASFGEENYDRLSEQGIQQSRVLAGYFIDAGIYFDAAYSGTLERQRKTAAVVAKSFSRQGISFPEVMELDGLNEHNTREILESIIPQIAENDPALVKDMETIPGDRAAFQRVFEKAMLLWVSGEYDDRGIASYSGFRSGISGAVRRIMKADGRGKNVAVFTSGGPIAAFAGETLNIPPESAIRVEWQIANASVTRFKCTREAVMLSSFNEISHMELSGDRCRVTYR